MDIVKSISIEENEKILANKIKVLKQENHVINKNVDGVDIPLSDEEKESVLSEWALHDLAMERYEQDRNNKYDTIQHYYERSLKEQLALHEVQAFLILLCETHGLVPEPKTG